MHFSSIPSWDSSKIEVASHGHSTLPRRVRHISSIQIRNLTPFPVRDAFASALSKPSAQPQFTSHGHLSDDLDVTVGRKRGRRISTASSIHSGPRSDEDGQFGSLDHSGEPTIRRRTSSRASIPLSTSTGSSGPKLARRPSNVGASPTMRPTLRSRALSITSSHSHQAASSSSLLPSDFRSSTSSIFSDLLRDTSQRSLEKILHSRLVETFITITLSSTVSSSDDTHPNGSMAERTDHPQASPSTSRPSSPSRLVKDKISTSKTTPRRGTVGAGNASTGPRAPTRHAPSASMPSVKNTLSNHGKSASVSSPNGKSPKPPSTASPQKARFPTSSPSSQSISVSSGLSKIPLTSQTPAGSSNEPSAVPDYISPLHWPSTNPIFQLNRYEFAPGTDLSGAKMRVDVWGRTSSAVPSTWQRPDGMGPAPGGVVDAKGKGKEKQVEEESRDLQWRVLESWEVALDELRPLPEDFAHNPAHVPSNTLLITLSSGETLYLPSPSLQSSSPSRAPSPNAGYNSDPETEGHRSMGGDIGLRTPRLDGGLDSMPTSPTLSEIDGTHRSRKRTVRSAAWQDLLKVINMQTVIIDTRQSLGEVVHEIDNAVVHNEANALVREVSEREAWVSELAEERFKVDRDAESLRTQISARREQLQKRREVLDRARQLHKEDLASEIRTDDSISEERLRLSSLRDLLPIMRSNLISIVSFIYPIELVSPPDLLFSILNVPLPIPIAATDPAPPLSLPAYKDVTEDSVATALGYSAQVVQMLAAYMGHRLIYPVTCVGSRSMIKDGISAMVGPRNFPLFSKGVDTYRFEYGVFLLNKDIEMLMSERNLRALDMRHTLPNLKNLLLTLTDNEQRSIPGHRVASSSVSISSLQSSESPVSAKSSLPSDSEPTSGTDAAGGDALDKDASTVAGASSSASSEGGATAGGSISRSSTPPASGTTTPTKATTPQRKTRAFLDLGFLTLRGRYTTASQKPSVKAVAETPEPEAQASLEGGANGSAPQGQDACGEGEAEVGDEDDEDDRRTIRGVRAGSNEEVVEGKVVSPGADEDPRFGVHVNGGTANGREKVVDDAVAQSPPPPPLVLSS